MTRAPARGGSRDARLLDELREGFGLPTDSALAAWLGIDPSALSGVRTGRHGFGILQRLKVLDRMGFLRTRKLVESLVPETLAAEIVRWSHRNANQRAAAAIGQIATEDANVRVLDAAKIALGFDTDAELAEFLGVKGQAISMVRGGRSGLGERPKLKILAAVAKDVNLAEIERALDSTDHLIQLIKDWSEGGDAA